MIPNPRILATTNRTQAPAETSSAQIIGSDHGLNAPTSDLATDATANIPWDVIDDVLTALAATEK